MFCEYINAAMSKAVFEIIEGWIALSLKLNLPIPSIEDPEIKVPVEA